MYVSSISISMYVCALSQKKGLYEARSKQAKIISHGEFPPLLSISPFLRNSLRKENRYSDILVIGRYIRSVLLLVRYIQKEDDDEESKCRLLNSTSSMLLYACCILRLGGSRVIIPNMVPRRS